MTSNKSFNNSSTPWFVLCLALASFATGCGAASSGSSSTSSSGVSDNVNGPTLAPLTGSNVMTLSVNGSLCSAATSTGYQNKPCVSVTVCDSAGVTCSTFNDILLDTGSYGLRIFDSVIKSQSPALEAALTPMIAPSNNNPIVECVNYADDSADWGPVTLASVQLAGESPIQVPIQMINSSFADPTGSCFGTLDTTPEEAGFQGILGVGLFAQDCGSDCGVDNGMYFTCSTSAKGTSTCTSYAATTGEQVTNPVSLLPSDNNGVIVELPQVDLGGQGATAGYVVLGIGTQSNNQPGQVVSYAADPNVGEFRTTFSGKVYASSFVDSGSNAYYFDAPSALSSELPNCGANAEGFYCPSSTLTFTAKPASYNSLISGTASFDVGNLLTLLNTSNNVFTEMAGTLNDGGSSFDWGLPFFYGKDVYVGLENTPSTLGVGPYWAF
jgi:hypothetical protein